MEDADIQFFLRHFGRRPSKELDQIMFARANRALEAGDFRSVLATLQEEGRVMSERRFERRLLILQARTALTKTPPTEKVVHQLMDEWNRAHAGTPDDWSELPSQDKSRSRNSDAGRLMCSATRKTRMSAFLIRRRER